jgi:hypothetical protein
MRYFRFNIAGILGAILFLALGFAALREAEDLWDSGLFSLTLGLLLAAVLLAVHRTEARRAFGIGFALFGIKVSGTFNGPPATMRRTAGL